MSDVSCRAHKSWADVESGQTWIVVRHG